MLGVSNGAQNVEGHIAESGQDMGSRSLANLAGVFYQGRVANPMHTVLDVPVAAPPVKQLSGESSSAGALVTA